MFVFMLSPVRIPNIIDRRSYRLVSINVAAGFPSPAADDQEDTVDPFAWVVRHESATFWWRVSGDSLVDEGIFDGDLIAVDRAGKARPGRIVLAVVEGGVTVKVIERRDGELWLMPRSRKHNYPPIRMTEDCEIWGVVAGVVRRYPVE